MTVCMRLVLFYQNSNNSWNVLKIRHIYSKFTDKNSKWCKNLYRAGYEFIEQHNSFFRRQKSFQRLPPFSTFLVSFHPFSIPWFVNVFFIMFMSRILAPLDPRIADHTEQISKGEIRQNPKVRDSGYMWMGWVLQDLKTQLVYFHHCRLHNVDWWNIT